MTAELNFCQANKVIRRTVTIPAAAGTAATLSSLASFTDDQQRNCIGCKIMGKDASGGDRAALLSGDSTASLLQYTAAAADYVEPCRQDDLFTFHRANSGGAVTAIAVFYMMA